MKAFYLIPLKYQDFGKGKLNLRTKNAFFKSVKNIFVLNVAFSKSVLVLIKNGCNVRVLLYSFLILAENN